MESSAREMRGGGRESESRGTVASHEGIKAGG